MVEERIEDGRRIAELLASELEGLETGPLAAVAVVDTESDASAGDVAYGIAHDGRQVGAVRLRARAAVVSLDRGWPATVPTGHEGLRRDGPADLVVERGAAVKHAVDAIRDLLA